MTTPSNSETNPTTNLPATTTSGTESAAEQLGRNEPCHCGSGKKFKRCHGVGAAPKLSMPSEKPMDPSAAMNPTAAMLGGMDPSNLDPEMTKKMQTMLQRLPRGQLIKLQSIMQRAMAGKDVSRESAEFERLLPPEFTQMARAMQAQSAIANGMGGKSEEMNASDAKLIVAEAVASGKMTAEQAKELLGDEDPSQIIEASKKGGIGKFFKKLTGK